MESEGEKVESEGEEGEGWSGVRRGGGERVEVRGWR